MAIRPSTAHVLDTIGESADTGGSFFEGPDDAGLSTGDWTATPDHATAPDSSRLWPAGGEAGEVVSPSGRSCGKLPTAARIQSWFTGLAARSSEYSRYDDSYPLSSPSQYLDMLGISQAEYDSVVQTVQWAGSPSEAQTWAAVAALDSEVSEEIVEGLAEPLAFLSRRIVFTVDRERLSIGTGQVRARVPVMDFTTTPLRRVLRRFRSLEEQETEALIRHDALDSDTQALLDAIRAAVVLKFNQSIDEVPDALLLQFEDFEDRRYHPTIGTTNSASPFMSGLWGQEGILGTMVKLLMPSRTVPPVYAFPLNWRANNNAEFVGTILSWLDTLNSYIASHNEAVGLTIYSDIEDWLESSGVVGLGALSDLRSSYDSTSGHVVVMTTEFSELLLADLMDKIEQARSTFSTSDADGGTEEAPSSSTGSSPDDPTTWWYDPGTSATTTTASSDGTGVVPAWVDMIVVGVTLAAPWLWIPYLMTDVDIEEDLDEITSALDSAFTTLIDGLNEAATPGRQLNDAMVIALLTAGTAFEAVRTSEIKILFYKKDFGEIARLSSAFEEKLLFGFETSAPFRALAVGLAGDWYDSWLSEGEALAATLPSEPATLLVAAIEELRSQYEAAVPVWTIDPAFLDWEYADFESYTWYYHQGEVSVDAAGDLSEGGTPRNLAAWVEAISPLAQLVLSINAASALLEAGLQAESFPLAISGLPTGDDSMAEQTRAAFDVLDMSKLRDVLPGVSMPRFIAAVWRQAMTDRLLLDLQAEGCDMTAVYEVVRWMRSSTYRAHIDTLLGPLDAELGRRRYEDGLVGRMGQFASPDGILPDEWMYYPSLDEAWGNLTADERETWKTALPYLLDRTRLDDLVALIEATRAAYGSAEEEIPVIDERDRVDPAELMDEVDPAEGGLDTAVLSELARFERYTTRGMELGRLDEVVLDGTIPLDRVAAVGSTTGWRDVLVDEELAAAERWVAMAEGMGSTSAGMLRRWTGA